jgi:hypothetical protein
MLAVSYFIYVCLKKIRCQLPEDSSVETCRAMRNITCINYRIVHLLALLELFTKSKYIYR